MNFLAHFTLAYPEPPLIVGNFLGDFIRNRQLSDFSKGIRQGVALHRQIDVFTDNHPSVRQLTARWHGAHHKYAPVVADVLFDYALTKDWREYGPLPQAEFFRLVYEVLRGAIPTFPTRLAQRTEAMIADNWLRHYTTVEGLSAVERRMKQRVSRPDLFGSMIPTLQKDEAYLQEIFRDFFPDVKAFVAQQKEVILRSEDSA